MPPVEQAARSRYKEHYILSRGTAQHKFQSITQGRQPLLPVNLRVESLAGDVTVGACRTVDELDRLTKRIGAGWLVAADVEIDTDTWVRLDIRPD